MNIYERRALDKYGCSYSQLDKEQQCWVDVFCDSIMYDAREEVQ
jgi:hypothetical protein